MIEREKTSNPFGNVVFLLDQRMAVTMMAMMVLKLDMEITSNPWGCRLPPSPRAPRPPPPPPLAMPMGPTVTIQNILRKVSRDFSLVHLLTNAHWFLSYLTAKKSQNVETDLLLQKTKFEGNYL